MLRSWAEYTPLPFKTQAAYNHWQLVKLSRRGRYGGVGVESRFSTLAKLEGAGYEEGLMLKMMRLPLSPAGSRVCGGIR